MRSGELGRFWQANVTNSRLIIPRVSQRDWNNLERIIVKKPTQYLGKESSEVWFDEMSRQYPNSDQLEELRKLFLSQLDSDLISYQQLPQSRQTVKTTSRIIPPMLKDAMIQFIGGPFNGQQCFYSLKKSDGTYIQNLDRWEMLSEEYLLKGVLRQDKSIYLLTAIPTEQTPFSDAQIFIGVFQS